MRSGRRCGGGAGEGAAVVGAQAGARAAQPRRRGGAPGRQLALVLLLALGGAACARPLAAPELSAGDASLPVLLAPVGRAPGAHAPASLSAPLFFAADAGLLAQTPPPEALVLQLPMGADGALAPAVAVRRGDVPAPDGVWAGELANARGALSSVMLALGTDAQGGAVVWGNALYWDAAAGVVRTTLIEPVAPSDPAAAPQGASAGALHRVVAHDEPQRAHALWHDPTVAGAAAGANASDAARARRRRRLAQDGGEAPAQPAPEPPPAAPEAPPAAPEAPPAAAPAGPWQHDVLVLYTPAAAADAGSAEVVRAAAVIEVGKTNKAYVDSGIPLRINLLAVQQARTAAACAAPRRAGRAPAPVEYIEPPPGPGAALPGILSAALRGDVPGAHAARDAAGADLVVLFAVDTGDAPSCGVAAGYNWASHVTANMDSASWAAIGGVGCAHRLVFTHELGHLQGCGHLSATEFMYGDLPRFAFGFERCDQGPLNFQDIMGTSMNHCGAGRTPPAQLAAFASPGLVGLSGLPLGDASTADCARQIAELAPVVANYRDRGCPPGEYACAAAGGCIAIDACCSDADCADLRGGALHCPAPGGACVACPAGTKRCGRACIPRTACCATPDDCGGGMACPASGGECAVQAQDLASKPVAPGARACPAGQRPCGASTAAACIPVGSCCAADAPACPPPLVCPGSGGACRCPAGQRACGGRGGNGTTCIPAGTCCASDAQPCPSRLRCFADGEACRACAAGLKVCGLDGACVSEAACCTHADCLGRPDNFCVKPRSGAGGGGKCGCRPGTRLCGDGRCTATKRRCGTAPARRPKLF
ncbi:hypothetical protein HT031_004465 [Scenedesmus sp. PABB004]|nr:hypothetical protein HT031_004465 [Scenedesmus sp. PABB004]